MIVRDPAGVTVLTLGDSEHVGGYLVSENTPGPRQWRRTVVESARVDYGAQVSKSRMKVTYTLRVDVIGASESEAKSRMEALIAAAEDDLWILDVNGDATTDLWLCDAADSEPTRYPDGSWSVVLTIPAQPAT